MRNGGNIRSFRRVIPINPCLTKYFGGLEITRTEAANLLKNLLCVCTMGELERLIKRRELPPCVLLLFRVLCCDADDGQSDMLLSIMDSVF